MADDPEISFLVTIKFGEEQSFTDDLDEAKERAAEAVRLCIQEDVGDRAQVNVSALPDPHPRGADMTDLSAEELVRDAIQKLHRKIEALRPRHPCAEGEAMTDDPEITDPRDPYKRRDDIVAELDAEIALWEPLPYRVPIHLLARRARDEIVALREMREAEFRMLSTNRDEVLEVAAHECDEEAKGSGGEVAFRDGCETCAAAIRALKDKER